MAKGICKLTRGSGKFVRSHLIPKALTRSTEPGAPFVQSGSGGPPTRRWSSWYDGALVTRAGEDILSALDNWAIPELRRTKLVWSGWGSAKLLDAEHQFIPESPWGVREIDDLDPKRLRLFFLSLLWRAAATDRIEFGEVVMPTEHLEQLRTMLVRNETEPLSFYPAQLTQLSTLGFIHNQTPLADRKLIPAIEDQTEFEIPIFRFYFDGLTVHMHRQVSDDGLTSRLGPLVVGGGAKLAVGTVTYEASFQRENIELIMSDAIMNWPHVLARL